MIILVLKILIDLSSRISYQHDQIKPKSLVSKDYLNINQ